MTLKLILVVLCISSTLGSRSLDLGPFCMTGWQWFDGKCYQINTPKPKVTWSTAKNNCEKQGARLYLPTSENIDDGIWDLYVKAGGVWRYWINVKDLQENLKYTDGEGRTLQYTKWDALEPDFNGGCAKTVIDQGRVFWQDIKCTDKADYICVEYPSQCFRKDVLYVENSIQQNNATECKDLCFKDPTCKWWSYFSPTGLDGPGSCGIRKYQPSNLIKVKDQYTSTREYSINGFISDAVFVGKANFAADQEECLRQCQADPQCNSCTFSDETTDNPMICTFNYGDIERILELPSNSGIVSSTKCLF